MAAVVVFIKCPTPITQGDVQYSGGSNWCGLRVVPCEKSANGINQPSSGRLDGQIQSRWTSDRYPTSMDNSTCHIFDRSSFFCDGSLKLDICFFGVWSLETI